MKATRKQLRKRTSKTLRGGAKVNPNNVKREIANVQKAQTSGRALTPKEQEVYNFLQDKAGAKRAAPPSLEFLQRSYYNDPTALTGSSWSNALKAIVPNASMTLQNKKTLLQQYKTEVSKKSPLSKTVAYNLLKKTIAIDNRIQDLLKEEAAGAGAGAPMNPDTHAGVVVKFSDGKVLYTVGKDIKGNELYGFPKGHIDMKTIGGVAAKEDSRVAALRELEEETGFSVKGNQLQRKTFNAIGKATGDDPHMYTIQSMNEERRTYSMGSDTINAYYLILEVRERSSDQGPSLTPLTENAMHENIVRCEIQEQYDPSKAQPRRYNRFSQFRF